MSAELAFGALRCSQVIRITALGVMPSAEYKHSSSHVMNGWFQPWPGAQGRWLKMVVLQEVMVTTKAGEFTGFNNARKH